MEPEPPSRQETVAGLDPRKLFARAAERFDVSALLRAWEPPSVEQIAALFPHYEVLALVGRGGMGAVYRARQPGLERDVAIKLVPAEAAADEEFSARFRVEARALAKLQHPNIVSIHEIGQTSEGHLFFVMEFVDGTDLAHLIQSGELRAPQALEIVSRVCEALQFAHQHGVVHRDIKPANVLVDRSGAVKVADFGLAKLHPESGVRSSRHSLPGSVIGTPDYMAPEQLDGRDVDARSDIFSLGVMLYEMLTGQLPRGAWEPPSRKAQTDARLDGVVNKALQTEPERRYQQASEVRTAVDGIRTSPVRNHAARWRTLGLVVALAVLIVASIWNLDFGRESFSARSASPAPEVDLDAAPSLHTTQVGTLLGALDLRSAIVSGEWRWKDGHAGAILEHPRTRDTGSLRVKLPFRSQGRAYKLTFDLVLLDEQANAGVIFPVDDTRTGLMLNLNGSSGLALVRRARWDHNETTTTTPLPIGVPMTVVLKVGPYYDGATIMVEVDRRGLMKWQGQRRELSAFEDPHLGWTLPDPDDLGFASYGGGIEISNVEVEILQIPGR